MNLSSARNDVYLDMCPVFKNIFTLWMLNFNKNFHSVNVINRILFSFSLCLTLFTYNKYIPIFCFCVILLSYSLLPFPYFVSFCRWLILSPPPPTNFPASGPAWFLHKEELWAMGGDVSGSCLPNSLRWWFPPWT